jgi:hypothetical protein
MSTTRRDKWAELIRVLLLGLVMALGIGVLAGAAEAAWLGFALAAMYAETSGGRARLTRRPAG